jgi:hypothetical protein
VRAVGRSLPPLSQISEEAVSEAAGVNSGGFAAIWPLFSGVELLPGVEVP